MAGSWKVVHALTPTHPPTSTHTHHTHHTHPPTHSKPVKTHAEESNVKSDTRKGYTLGVAVDPIKLSSLESFGTPEFVGDRIIKVRVGVSPCTPSFHPHPKPRGTPTRHARTPST